MTHPAPNSELTAESVKLLKAGDVLWSKAHKQPVTVMSADAIGVIYHHDQYAPEGIFLSDLMVSDWLTFIGRPDADGWMLHDGGPNPVPGRSVDYQTRHGYDGSVYLSEHLVWPDIIAFRLAAPSVEKVMPCPKCGARSGDDWEQCKGSCPMPGSPHYDPSPKPDVAGARERLEGYLEGELHLLQDADLRLILSAYDRQGEEIERLLGALESIADDDEPELGNRNTNDLLARMYWEIATKATRARQGGPDHG